MAFEGKSLAGTDADDTNVDNTGVQNMTTMHARQARMPRPRREVHPALLAVAKPFFRRSYTRDAYVLRVVGERRGPVLRQR